MKEEKQKFTLQIPSGITDIGDFAFRYESFDGIKSIVLPHSVEYIGESAFENANNVKYIVLSGGIKRIGINAFARCKQLDSIAFRQGPPHCLNYLTQNGVLFERNYDRFSKSHGYTLFQYPCGRANKEYTIPVVVDDGATDGGVEVTEIGENAFMECQHLEAVNFTAYPGTKMKISRCAFAWCSNLDTVRLSKNISKIDPTAFEGCRALKRILIPKGTRKKFEALFPLKQTWELLMEE